MTALTCTVPAEVSAPIADTSWKPVIALGIAAFVMVTTEFMPVGLIPSIAASLGQTEGRVGLMVTLPGMFAAISALAVLLLARRLNRRLVLAGLVSLLALSNLIVFLSSSFQGMLIGRALMGIAIGGFWTVGGSLGPRLQPRNAAKAGAVILSGVSLGMVAGMPAGAFLGELFGWRWAFGMAGIVSVLVLALMLAVMPSLPSRDTKGLRDVPALLRMPKVRLGLLIMFLIFGGHFLAYTFVAPFLIQVTGMTPLAVGGILLIYGIAAFAGNLVGGWVSGRNLWRAMLSATLMLGLPTLILAMLGDSPVIALPVLMLWGIGFGMQAITVQSWIFAAAPKQLEAVQAMFVSLSQVAIGSGALVGGYLVDGVGVVSPLWTAAAIAFAAALAFVVLTRSGSASRSPA